MLVTAPTSTPINNQTRPQSAADAAAADSQRSSYAHLPIMFLVVSLFYGFKTRSSQFSNFREPPSFDDIDVVCQSSDLVAERSKN